jgi:stearoyl-CoA desaturase (Delta-9 desaturase)
VTRTRMAGNLLGVFLPFAALALAVVLLWDEFVGPEVLAITAVMYVITALGVTVGLHRLFAHRAFSAGRGVRMTFAVLGTMSMQGMPIRWVANHRKHHAFTDEEGDPHSPHLTGHDGFVGALAGLWHAHMGWFFTERASRRRYAPDLLADPVMRFVDKTTGLWILLGLLLPFAAGFVILGTVEGALLALLWGGAVRIFLLQHVTFSINSLCHFSGRRRFETEDESRNVRWLAPISMGESWHNNHHAFPTSAFHGLRRREIDPGGWVITGLERLGLAWDVKRVSPARQQKKLRTASPEIQTQASSR